MDFISLSVGFLVGAATGQHLAYFLEDHESLEQQINILESHGLIHDVTEHGKKVKKYQFQELFVEHLKSVN